MPLSGKGYFPMHDDTQVARVIVMGKALRQGQFPVRWVSDLGYGYGYPIFNFYGPLPYYVGGGLYALGVDSVIATKVMFGFGAMLAAIFSFLLFESAYGFLGGLVGSVVFAYAPYHAVEIYVRGAVGEYWAIAFVPLILWGMLLICQKKKHIPGIVIGSLGLAGVIVSHTILGFLTVVFVCAGVALYIAVHVSRKTPRVQLMRSLLAVLIVGLGLSAFFWLPALLEMKATGVTAMIQDAPTGFFDHFVCIGQLWDSPWGYGGSAPGCAADGMSFKLGKFHIIMAIMGIVVWIILLRKRKKNQIIPIMIIGILLLCISILGTIGISKSLWSVIPFISFIQYPWRLLSFTMLAVGICSGYVVAIFRKRSRRIALTIGVIIVCIFVNAKLFRPQYVYMRDSKAFEDSSELRFRISKISDEYLPPDIVKPKIQNDIVKTPVQVNGALQARTLEETDTYLRVALDSAGSQRIVINKAFFPGWIYKVDGHEVVPSIALGLPSVIVSEGKSILELRFTDTGVRQLANIISLLSIVTLGGVVLYGKKTNA